jgi:uncharacterized protein YlzI (FlbEa/FlbD family)
MDQDWEPVILRKSNPVGVSQKTPLNFEKKPDNDIIKKKIVRPESIQELITRRSELHLTQKEADAACNFPVNTFRDIEGKRLIPNEKQQNVIQRIMNVQLKVVTTK